MTVKEYETKSADSSLYALVVHWAFTLKRRDLRTVIEEFITLICRYSYSTFNFLQNVKIPQNYKISLTSIYIYCLHISQHLPTHTHTHTHTLFIDSMLLKYLYQKVNVTTTSGQNLA